MRTAALIARLIVAVTGITQVILGILFWTNRALALLPLHMMVGLTFVLAILVLVGLAARAGLRWWHVVFAAAWALVVPVFGMMQVRLLPGTWHWVIEVTHLLIGVVAMVVGVRLAAFVRQAPRARQGQ